ncbi:MAG: hypothetical protein LBD11_08885 [Candidatus Peribacteria bacterium]|jgi:RNase H-fold protein (predicted Holliday junction resolvase)|nr:hypothetical protein [Candidatus Peribacteria bacterium]
MKLQEYFTTQHTFSLSDQHKAELFSQITQKRLEQSVAKWHFFTYKRVSYTFVALVVALFTFGSVMIERNGGIDNFFFSSDPLNLGSVYADYIAEIIDVNGEWYLQNGENTLSSQYIHNGDVLHLKQGSEIIINLEDGSQAKIIGPAECVITKLGEKSYQIILTEGIFFKIVNETSDNDFEIIAEDITLRSEKNQPLNLQIAKNNGETLVKNSGGNAMVVSKKDPLHKEEKLLTKEIVSIKDNDITTITPEGFTTFLAKNNITETLFLFKDDEISSSKENLVLHTTEAISTGNFLARAFGRSSGEVENKEIDLSNPLDLPDIGEVLFLNQKEGEDDSINENIKVDLGLSQNEPKVPSTSQTDVLKNSLNGFFLINIFERIALATREGDTLTYTESLNDLTTKVNAIAQAFGQDTKASVDFTEIKKLILNLKTTLTAEYYISPSQVEQFSKLANRCDYLIKLTNEGLSPDTAQEKWESLQAHLPETLQMR